MGELDSESLKSPAGSSRVTAAVTLQTGNCNVPQKPFRDSGLIVCYTSVTKDDKLRILIIAQSLKHDKFGVHFIAKSSNHDKLGAYL